MSNYQITVITKVAVTEEEAEEIAKAIKMFSGVKLAITEHCQFPRTANKISICPVCNGELIVKPDGTLIG